MNDYLISNINKDSELIVNNLTNTDTMLLSILELLGLPSTDVLSTVEERKTVLLNLPAVINLLDESPKNELHYLSKFFVAVCNGLFDAALNYLWDETMKQLKLRVVNLDLNYFFDIVISDENRSKFKTAADLLKMDDNSIIDGAYKVGLISTIGYTKLDYIRYMRNFASAAHPNQNELTGLDLISWMQICIKEIITLPLSNIVIKINQLLSNIKKETIDNQQAETISIFFKELRQEEINSLVKGFFGIYIDSDTSQTSRNNINLLLPNIWELASEETKYNLGTRVANFIANGNNNSKNLGQEFLGIVNGDSYLPDPIKIPKIKSALDNLNMVHNQFNNFYNEPSFAKQLYNIIGEKEISIPKPLDFLYVKCIMNVFMTNGNGVCWGANEIYIDMIKQFNERQKYIAITSFVDEKIKSKLQFNLCKEKFKEMLDLVLPDITSGIIIDLANEIKEEIRNLHSMNVENKLIKKINILNKNFL